MTDKIYAYSQINAMLGDGYGMSVDADNMLDIQDALDMDIDNTFRVRKGMLIQKSEDGRIAIYDNSFGGYSRGGTNLIAVIR